MTAYYCKLLLISKNNLLSTPAQNFTGIESIGVWGHQRGVPSLGEGRGSQHYPWNSSLHRKPLEHDHPSGDGLRNGETQEIGSRASGAGKCSPLNF